MYVFPRCEGVPFCAQAGKGLLSVNRCLMRMTKKGIVLFSSNSTVNVIFA